MEKLENDRYYLFGYYEYTGRNYKTDMEKLAAEPRNQEWLSCDRSHADPIARQALLVTDARGIPQPVTDAGAFRCKCQTGFSERRSSYSEWFRHAMQNTDHQSRG